MGKLPEVLQAVVDAAIAGDMQAARIILERTVPSIKPTELPLEGLALPAADASLTQQATDILAAATRGEVAPAQAAQLIASIGAVGKLMETDELRVRIERLEAAHGNT